MPKDDDLPGTLQRSPAKARRTFRKTRESAEETYDGDPEASNRVAFAALKHSFEKVGDHWEEKDQKGPSDEQAAKTGREAREGKTPTAGGVDVLGHTRKELYDRATDLGVTGRSKMTKQELGQAIARKQD